jgi:hypothetical protein
MDDLYQKIANEVLSCHLIIEGNIDEVRKNHNATTAINGFKEEEFIVEFINSNNQFREKLVKLDSKILLARYRQLKGTTKIDITNGHTGLQIKKYKHKIFGQLDRRPLYSVIHNIPALKKIRKYLQNLFELELLSCGKMVDKTQTIVKLTYDNYSQQELTTIVKIINEQKSKLIEMAFHGFHNKEKPIYLFGIEYKNKQRNNLIIYKITDIIEYLQKHEFQIKKSGTVIELAGCFSIQRKGGDAGKKTSNDMQTKLVFSKLPTDMIKLKFVFPNY